MAEAGGEGASLLRQQVTFSGESSCAAFQFHRLMPHLCTGECNTLLTLYKLVDRPHQQPPVHHHLCPAVDCNKDISKHASAAVGDEDVRRALDSIPSRLKLPSEILPATSTSPTTGGLFLGGYHAVDKVQLDKHGIAHVVSCAVGLEVFGPRFASNVSAAKAGGCEFETLPWVDKPEQVIGRDELERALRFIHAARGSGSSVLVHCARVGGGSLLHEGVGTIISP